MVIAEGGGKDCRLLCATLSCHLNTAESHPHPLTSSLPHSRYPGNSALLSSWAMGDNPCFSWMAVVCNGPASVMSIDLGNFNLQGTLPSQLGDLHALTYLSLTRNALSGVIPTQIGALTSLQFLYLAYNPCLFGPLVTMWNLGTGDHYSGDGTALGELAPPTGCVQPSGNYSPSPSYNNGSGVLPPYYSPSPPYSNVSYASPPYYYSNSSAPPPACNGSGTSCDLNAMVALRSSWCGPRNFLGITQMFL